VEVGKGGSGGSESGTFERIMIGQGGMIPIWPRFLRKEENRFSLLFPCGNSLTDPNSLWQKTRYRRFIPQRC
jgi:hypothetical protein